MEERKLSKAYTEESSGDKKPKKLTFAPPSEEFPGSILGVSLEEFRRLRNKLPEQQNLALQFIYEYKMYDDPEKLADILGCGPSEVREITKLARENFEKLKNRQV